MAVPIRTIVLALCVMTLLIYSSILFIGNVATANNLPLNSTIENDYLILSGNLTAVSQTNNTLFKPIGALNSQIQNLQSDLSNGNILGAGLNTLGLVASFFSSLPAIFWSFATLISIPFTAIGVPTAFALAIGLLMMVALMVLAIISALFLFPT